MDVGDEVLQVSTDGTDIVADYDSSTGTLTLTGLANLVDYQQVLRTLAYQHLAVLPDKVANTTPRTIEVSVNDGQADSLVAESLVEIELPNTPPTVDLNGPESGTGFTAILPWGETSIPVAASAAACTDPDSPTLSSLSVTIANPADGDAEWLSADVLNTVITSDYDTATYTLTLSGVDTLENYERVIRSTRYQNSNPARSTATREIQVVAHDGLNAGDVATASVQIVGGMVHISGFVYADVNNNGIKDAPELGLPNVPITLSGTVETVALTEEDGSFAFPYLPAGTYDLHETQPAAFIDGIDTAEELFGGWAENDYFHEMAAVTGTHMRCNFGELGLHAHLISKRQYLASSPPGLEMIQDMMIDSDEWIGFRADQTGVFTAELEGGDSQSMLELYTAEFLPVVVGPGMTSVSAPINEDEIYVLHAAGETPLALRVEVIDPADDNDFSVLDVNTDGLVTAIDALLIINYLNEQGSGPAGMLTHLDPSGDGVIAPLDALLVINDMNRRLTDGNGEGESVVALSEAEHLAMLEASQTVIGDESWMHTYRQLKTRSQREHRPRVLDIERRWYLDPPSIALPIGLRVEPDPVIRRSPPAEKVHKSELQRRHDVFRDDFEETLGEIVDDINQWWKTRRT
jgi:hypothetical protein